MYRMRVRESGRYKDREYARTRVRAKAIEVYVHDTTQSTCPLHTISTAHKCRHNHIRTHVAVCLFQTLGAWGCTCSYSYITQPEIRNCISWCEQGEHRLRCDKISQAVLTEQDEHRLRNPVASHFFTTTYGDEKIL